MSESDKKRAEAVGADAVTAAKDSKAALKQSLHAIIMVANDKLVDVNKQLATKKSGQ